MSLLRVAGLCVTANRYLHRIHLPFITNNNISAYNKACLPFSQERSFCVSKQGQLTYRPAVSCCCRVARFRPKREFVLKRLQLTSDPCAPPSPNSVNEVSWPSEVASRRAYGRPDRRRFKWHPLPPHHGKGEEGRGAAVAYWKSEQLGWPA